MKNRLPDMEDFLARGVFYGICLALLSGTFIIISSGIYSFLFHFYIIVANISLGSYVFFQNRKNSINRSFFMATFFVALWITCGYLADNAISAEKAIFWGKAIFMSSALIPATFLYFIFAFLNKIQYFAALRKIFLFVPGLVFLLILPTNLLIYNVELYSWGIKLIYGPLFSLFIIYFVSYVIFAFYNLAIEYGAAHGIKKAQIGYLFLGTLISIFLVAITNLILPLLFGITAFYGLGAPSTIIMVCFIFYSIIKHRLMNIEFVIQKGFIYSVLSILIMATYAIAIILSEQFISGILGYETALIIIASAVIIAVTYQPILNTLQDVTDKIFFRTKYDYQRTLRDISKALASVMRIRQLVKYIVEILVNAIKVGEISFLVFDKTKNRYRSVPIEYRKESGEYKKIEIDVKSRIIDFLRSRKIILVADELGFEIAESKLKNEPLNKISFLEDLENEMERLGMAVWAPVISKGELIGVVSLGYKLSGDMYTEEDLRLLVTLSNQLAVSLENTRLYEEILETKSYSDNILQSMTSGVAAADLAGKVVTFNKAFETMIGLKADQIKEKNISQIFKDSAGINEMVKNAIAGNAVKNAESFIVKGDDLHIPVSFSSVQLKDSSNNKTGLLFILSDLSEVKALESRVRRTDKLAALGTMAAGMAHEIKNPLSSIKVFSQLMPQRFDDEEYRRKFTEIVPKEVARVDRIVESLLGFARASEPKLEQCNVRSIIEDLMRDYDEQIESSNIKVQKNLEDVPEIVVDKDQIAQVFSNLILNAIHVMPSGGNLDIQIKKGKEGNKNEPFITVSVSDTGHGIPKESLKKLFDPFFTTKHGGTGLGLTISHSIIEGHKGTIDVKSEVGKGTSFIVTLPVSL